MTFYGWFWVTPEAFRCPPTQLNNGRVGFLKFAHFEMQVFIKNRQASDSIQEIGLAAPKDALKFGATGNCSLGWAILWVLIGFRDYTIIAIRVARGAWRLRNCRAVTTATSKNSLLESRTQLLARQVRSR